MNTDILEELGLTKTEIKVYITLLELGSSSAGIILDKSKLPNSTIHRDLNS
jgi:sugar-specific transcriptional regulator TrmB